eukprot:scaffold3736_cov74-Phaeocystis_antarctica.AAC.1
MAWSWLGLGLGLRSGLGSGLRLGLGLGPPWRGPATSRRGAGPRSTARSHLVRARVRVRVRARVRVRLRLRSTSCSHRARHRHGRRSSRGRLGSGIGLGLGLGLGVREVVNLEKRVLVAGRVLEPIRVGDVGRLVNGHPLPLVLVHFVRPCTSSFLLFDLPLLLLPYEHVHTALDAERADGRALAHVIRLGEARERLVGAGGIGGGARLGEPSVDGRSPRRGGGREAWRVERGGLPRRRDARLLQQAHAAGVELVCERGAPADTRVRVGPARAHGHHALGVHHMRIEPFARPVGGRVRTGQRARLLEELREARRRDLGPHQQHRRQDEEEEPETQREQLSLPLFNDAGGRISDDGVARLQCPAGGGELSVRRVGRCEISVRRLVWVGVCHREREGEQEKPRVGHVRVRRARYSGGAKRKPRKPRNERKPQKLRAQRGDRQDVAGTRIVVGVLQTLS